MDPSDSATSPNVSATTPTTLSVSANSCPILAAAAPAFSVKGTNSSFPVIISTVVAAFVKNGANLPRPTRTTLVCWI